MSNDDLEQTFIPKDHEDKWRKGVHGEIAVVDDEGERISAETIRNYLVIRDEAAAVNQIAETDDLNTLSEEEARVVFQQATQEIKRRGRGGSNGVEFLKTYGAAALIGGLSVALGFLLIAPPERSAAPSLFVDENLNFSDYPIARQGEMPKLMPNMLLIPGGTLHIGCEKGWDDVAGGCRANEYPSHLVSVDTFELAQHETTVGQFKKFVDSSGYATDAEKEGKGCVHKDINTAGQPFVMNRALNWRNPGYEQNEGYPVTCVSWQDAQAYVAWLSAKTKTAYRLPTEAEWEYAARSSVSTAYYWGSVASHDHANYSDVGGQDGWSFAAPVGRFPGNKFSVQDTSGNLWEWVQDCWHDTYHNAPNDGSAWEKNCDKTNSRVRRGGAWDGKANGIRSAIRSSGGERDRSYVYGFRVARNWQKLKK